MQFDRGIGMGAERRCKARRVAVLLILKAQDLRLPSVVPLICRSDNRVRDDFFADLTSKPCQRGDEQLRSSFQRRGTGR